MAINTIQFATLLQQKLDEQVTVQSTSGWMESNAGLVQYDGGKEIKVPSLSTTGLTDYDRDAGFTAQGKVTLSRETLTMTQDRSATFQLDAMDVNESGFLANGLCRGAGRSRAGAESMRCGRVPARSCYSRNRRVPLLQDLRACKRKQPRSRCVHSRKGNSA